MLKLLRQRIRISKRMIDKNDGGSLPITKLFWRRPPEDCDSVTFWLGPNAKRVYRYDAAQPVTFSPADGGPLPSVALNEDGDELTVTIAPDSSWQQLKLTFHFRYLAEPETAPVPLDPIIRNGGRGGGGSN